MQGHLPVMLILLLYKSKACTDVTDFVDFLVEGEGISTGLMKKHSIDLTWMVQKLSIS